MLVSLLFSSLIALGAPGIPDAEPVPPAEHWYNRLPDDVRNPNRSTLYFGLPANEVRKRFTAAVSNAYQAYTPAPEWYWVLRSLGEVGIQVDIESAIRMRAEANPGLLEVFRSAATNSAPKVRAFYSQTAPKIFRKKKLALNVEDAYLMVNFQGGCSAKKKNENEKIYKHLSELAAAALKSAGREPRGGFDFLVELRDRQCLSEQQYRKLADPEVTRLRAKMPEMVPADLIRAIYYLVHGGFADAVRQSDILRAAEGQGLDGNWGPAEKRSGPTTPLYGAYVWAWVLSRGGTPVSAAEFEAAQNDQGDVVEEEGL